MGEPTCALDYFIMCNLFRQTRLCHLTVIMQQTALTPGLKFQAMHQSIIIMNVQLIPTMEKYAETSSAIGRNVLELMAKITNAFISMNPEGLLLNEKNNSKK